jgi:hypothetical protein
MFWAKLERFKEAIKEAWRCSPVIADPYKRSGSLFLEMRQAIANAVILRLDAAQDSRLQSPAEIWLRRSLKLSFSACLRWNARLLDGVLDCSGYRKEMLTPNFYT